MAAREEERRRLRRDLHDGLGTVLTAVTLKADAAHNLRRTDPERSGRLLLDLRADVTTAIADIRRLVYDLRPPDLDELGLVGALRRRAQQSWRREHAGCVVTVDAPDDLPPLPAAVEVAGEVSDNGSGGAGAWPHGVGLRSMHERAAELGGTLTAGPTDRGGRVHARLPLERS
ncbi:histidine kinase [Microbispora sp. NPDC046933]|uniref:sensor histidine kinase n=1 Tax=Microbispora sp. NPDC046933 TaxID=3155618 RepID=UPI0033D7762F